jgi:hypothetical protein
MESGDPRFWARRPTRVGIWHPALSELPNHPEWNQATHAFGLAAQLELEFGTPRFLSHQIARESTRLGF